MNINITPLDMTVCFLLKDNRILLGYKTQKIGKDCWNGYGGHVENGESIEGAAVRELSEESDTHTSLEYLKKIAVVDYHNTKSDGSSYVARVHYFLVSIWNGSPKESSEMITPTWFHIDNLPLGKMMPADKHWLPLAVKGGKIVGRFTYGPEQKTIIGDFKIEEVIKFPY